MGHFQPLHICSCLVKCVSPVSHNCQIWPLIKSKDQPLRGWKNWWSPSWQMFNLCVNPYFFALLTVNLLPAVLVWFHVEIITYTILYSQSKVITLDKILLDHFSHVIHQKLLPRLHRDLMESCFSRLSGAILKITLISPGCVQLQVNKR